MRPTLCSLLILLTLSLNAATVRIVGSDFLPPDLSEALAAFAASQGDRVTVEFRGSAHAIENFEAGDATLAIFATPSRNPPDPAYRITPFARKAAIIAVHESNPLNALNAEQVAAVFGAQAARLANRWSDLGLEGEWASRNIQLVSVSEYQFLAVPTLISRVIPGYTLRQGTLIVDTQNSAENVVASDPSAIAILDRLPTAANIKTLAIAGGDGFPFPPTADNVNFKDYPATVDFYLGLPLSYDPVAERYAEFLLSDRVAEILTEYGFFAIPPSEREELRKRLLAGTLR